MRKPKVRGVIPRPNNFTLPDYAKRSLESLFTSDYFDFELVEPEGAEIHILRNTGVSAKFSNGEFFHVPGNTVSRSLSYCDYDSCIQIDTDMEYTDEDVAKLIERNVDIIGGAYQSRVYPKCYCAGKYQKIHGFVSPDTSINMNSTGLIPVDWLGTGFLLVKKHVFESLVWPWFWNGVRVYTDENNVSRAFFITEDVGFCLNAASHGYKIILDADTEIKHHI